MPRRFSERASVLGCVAAWGAQPVVRPRRWLAALSCGVLFACASPLSVEDERRVAIDSDREVRRSMPMMRDDVVNAYVDRLGQAIVNTQGPQPYEYRFQVIEDPDINAFTVGAGFVYVNTATLLQARNVSEVAGVIAHEIGHVMRRHVAVGYNRGRSAGILHTIGVIAGAVLLGQAGADLANIGGGIAAQAVLATYTREQESEADAFAVEVMPQAGYDPNGLVTFFQTMQREYGDGGIPFLMSHPAPSDRIEAARALIARSALPERLRVDDAGQLEIIQRRVRLLEKNDRRLRRSR